ncbi:MAG: metal ABC transporter substrate-binding protein [Mycoplasmatota bacterium]
MKKVILLLVCSLIFTGCLKRDNMEDIDIYTTAYPIEYITSVLYGEHSNVYSIYPDGVNIFDYSLTDKQIADYSSSSLFIFNGLSEEKDYVADMFSYNGNLKIINVGESMEINYSVEELWLEPSNFLMIAQNIRNGFDEYIENTYLKNEIEENYETLKLEMSNLDAKLKLLVSESSRNTIIASDDLFKYLEKYGFNVISLDEDSITDKILYDATTLLNSGEVTYIFTKKNEDLSDTVASLIDDGIGEIAEFNTLTNLTETQRNNKDTYITIMNENIELLRLELYQ